MMKLAMSVNGHRFEAEGETSLVLEKFDEWTHQLRQRGDWWVTQESEPQPSRPKKKRARKKARHPSG